jgi:hypothetical protein
MVVTRLNPDGAVDGTTFVHVTFGCRALASGAYGYGRGNYWVSERLGAN